jgi:hypothetical protein
MARPTGSKSAYSRDFTPATLERLNALKDEHAQLKASNAPKEQVDAKYAELRRVTVQRSKQLSHPTHGPILRALDSGKPSTSEEPAAQPVEAPSTAPAAKRRGRQSNQSMLEDLHGSYSNPETWATPGSTQHFEDVHAAGEDLGRWAAELEPHHPQEVMHPIFSALEDANKHLEAHADYNMGARGEGADGIQASAHLTAAALKLGHAAKEMAKLGGSDVPLRPNVKTAETASTSILAEKGFDPEAYAEHLKKVESAPTRTADYRNIINYVSKRAADYADEVGTQLGKVAKTPDNYRYADRLPEYGFGQPVKERMSTEESKLHRRSEKAYDEPTTAQRLAQAKRDETFRTGTLNGIPYAYGAIPTKTSTAASEWPPRKGALRDTFLTKSSPDEENLPLKPSEISQLGVGYTSEKQYKKAYGEAMAKRMANYQPLWQQQREDRRGMLQAEKAYRPQLERMAKESSAQADADRQARRDYAISKSLVGADGSPIHGAEAQVEGMLHQVVPHIRVFAANNTDDADPASPMTHPDDVKAVHNEISKKFPQFYKKLGPAGVDLAISRHNAWAEENSRHQMEDIDHIGEEDNRPQFEGEEEEATAHEAHTALAMEAMGLNEHFGAGRGGF